MGKDVEHTAFCDALYQSSITNEPHAQRSYIILWILCLIGTIIALFFWLWIRRRDKQFELGYIDKANTSFVYIYKFVIYIYISLVLIQTALTTSEVIMIEILNVPYDDFFISLIQSIIVTIPHFQMALIAFLYTKNTLSTKAFNCALKISIPYAILTFIVSLLDERSWITVLSGSYAYISTSSVLRVITDLIFECGCMLIVCRQCQYSWKRKYVIIRYLLIIMMITGFDFVAQIFESGKSDGNCITQIGFYCWYILYPFIFFQTIKDDSDYHWSYASKPLIESTQHSVADLDLFSLPGYHPAHFEGIKDKKFRFQKLKQIVSGYVNIIPFNKITFNNNMYNKQESIIGTGSTSKVYNGFYKEESVAVKCLSSLNKKKNGMSWTNLTLIFRESILSSSLSHPNIVKFLGVSLTYNAFFLVYEYCVYGDLQHILRNDNESKLCTIPQRLFYLKDIALGMKFLHDSGFVHRDLKTANIVVNFSNKKKRFIGKICDFGVSRKLPKEQYEIMNRNQSVHYNFNKSLSSDDNVSSLMEESISEKQWQIFAERGNIEEISRTIHVGTPAFLAPEILLKLVKSKGVDLEKEKRKERKREKKRLNNNIQNHYVRGAILNVDPHIYCDFATDVYSFGMILWSVITKKLPYKGYKPIQLILMIKNAKRLNITDDEWSKWRSLIDIDELKDLLEHCWAQYPLKRPCFKDIVKILQDIIQKSHRKHKYINKIIIESESQINSAIANIL